MTSIVDIALGPARLVAALPRIVEGLERLPDIADSLERIARFETSLEQLAGLSQAVGQLERVAGDLTHAVQPLQSMAQRLSRFGRNSAG